MVWLDREQLRAVKVLSKLQLQLRGVEAMIGLRDVSAAPLLANLTADRNTRHFRGSIEHLDESCSQVIQHW